MEFKRASHFKGEIRVPGDKSISHRPSCSAPSHRGLQRYTIFSRERTACLSIECFDENGNYLKANLLKGRDAKPEGSKVLLDYDSLVATFSIKGM